MTTQLLIEGILIILLLTGCVFGAIVNRRLRTIREGQEALMESLLRFDEATVRARENLVAMQSRATGLEGDLAEATDRAHGLINELSVMVHAGDSIAGRLEAIVDDVRRTAMARHERSRPKSYTDANNGLERAGDHS